MKYKQNIYAKAFLTGSALSIQSLVAVLLFNISLFNIGTMIDRYSQDIFYMVFGGFIYEDGSREQHSVILINDDTLKLSSFNNVWPLSQDGYAKILLPILTLEPKALMIDIEFVSMMNSKGSYNSEKNQCENQSPLQSERLKLVLSEYKESNIPVYLATSSMESFCKLPKELSQLTQPVSVSVNTDKSDFVARSYPLKDTSLNSAALELCNLISTNGICLNNVPQSFELTWGVRKNPDNTWMTRDSRAEDQLFSIAGDKTLLLDGYDAIKYQSPFLTTIFAHDIIQPTSNNRQALHNDLNRRINNKVIFLGANISNVDDIIYTSTRQFRPGIYYHAMAFDNLLTYRDDIKSRKKESIDYIIQFTTIFIIALYLHFLSNTKYKEYLASLLTSSQKEYFLTRIRRLALHLTYKLVGCSALPAAIAFLSILISFNLYNRPPSQIISYIGFIFASHYIESTNIKQKLIWALHYIPGKTKESK